MYRKRKRKEECGGCATQRNRRSSTGAQKCALKRIAADSPHSEIAASSAGLRQNVILTPQQSQRRVISLTEVLEMQFSSLSRYNEGPYPRQGCSKMLPEGAATEMTAAPESRTRRGGPDPIPRLGGRGTIENLTFCRGRPSNLAPIGSRRWEAY